MDLEKILPKGGPPIDEVSKYIEKYKNDLIVIKYGGNVFIDRKIFDNFITDINILNKLGISFTVVHGGGPRIKRELDKTNIQSKFNFEENDQFSLIIIRGLGVTDIQNQIDQLIYWFSSFVEEIKNFDKYLNPLINDFQLSFFEEFNQNNNQNILILNSNKDWLITFEKNNEDQFDISALRKLKDFNKYTLKQNEDIYSIYSKDILEEKDNVIKQLSFENIYSIESGGLQIISNHLIDGKEFEKISKKFFNLKSNKDKSAFLYSKVDIKDGNSNKIEYFSNLQDLNFLIKNILKISNEESLEIISQSIPEKNPIIYRETILNIL